MRGKKSKRNVLRGIDHGPLPASERLIAALQDAVNRARDKKLARTPERSGEGLNPFSHLAQEEAAGNEETARDEENALEEDSVREEGNKDQERLERGRG